MPNISSLDKSDHQKYIPISSYRLQLTKKFTFQDAIKILPYLKTLGVEMIYLSPFFQIEKDSLNPYKILTPYEVDSQVGGKKGFESFCSALTKHHMTHMIDLVPNHMGASVDNPWWFDLLKFGKKSKYAQFFDIEWEAGNGKIIIPFLHDGSKIIKKGEFLYVDDKKYPLKPGTENLSLEDILSSQNYQLIHWKLTHKKINYRRFFDISELVGIKMEDPNLYDLYHKTIFRWIKEGKVQGLRIDHPDGLLNPSAYLKKLNRDCKNLYIVCEKILQSGELLRPDWKAEGTVGYDVLNTLNTLFVNPKSEKQFDKIYQEFTGDKKDPQQLLIDLKRSYIKKYLESEIEIISKKIKEKEKLIELLAHFPIYRSFVKTKGKEIESADETLFKNAKFLLKDENRKALLRIQQLMPAVFAKGFEDTFLYRYNRLIALNEVGGNPTQFGMEIGKFHQINQKRSTHFPHSMITTSTHDTKRSLDVRMRIAVLSLIPKRWEAKIGKWRQLNGPFIDCNIEYFFYQTLIGFWPDDKQKSYLTYRKRLIDYMIKVVREGKHYTDWVEVNENYESDLIKFINKVLDNELFWKDFYPFNEEITLYGMYNTFSSLILKLTLPGVCDFYQGEELWRYDLVDPDNRQDVNFQSRAKLLEEINTFPDQKTLLNWFSMPHNAKLKMYIIHKGLQIRNQEKDLFIDGKYIPLETKDENTVAFIRKKGNREILVITPRFYIPNPPLEDLSKKLSGFIDIFTNDESTPLPFSIKFRKS